jgi:hypothetical protein
VTGVSTSNVERAVFAWADCPEWVLDLARSCDASSQGAVADRLGKSGGYVSRILNAKYTGSYDEAERQVRAILAGDEVDCPAFGPMPLSTCIRARRRKTPPINTLQRCFAQHCPTCPLNSDRKDD